MTKQGRHTGPVDVSSQRHSSGAISRTGTVLESDGEQSVQQAEMAENEPVKLGGPSSAVSRAPEVADTNALTPEQLETLACLLAEQEKWDATVSCARELHLPMPKRLQMKDVAETLGVSATTVTDRIRRIERRLGTYVVVHSDAAAPKEGRRRTKSRNPEETKEHLVGNPEAGGGTQLSPELTLDGRIWALYAELFLNLYGLVSQATSVPQPPTPPSVLPPVRRIAFPRGSKVLAQPTPQRPSEVSRERFLHWLRYQRQHLADAHTFLRENRYATTGNLDRLVPDYQPNPDEEPLYDYVDKFGEYPPGH